MPDATTCDCRSNEGEGRACEACTAASRSALVTFWIYASTCAAIAFAAGVVVSRLPY